MACRERKVKCDRNAPQCLNCTKRHLVCRYPSSFRNHSISLLTRALLEKNSQSGYYYGHNSSDSLERGLARSLAKKDPSGPVLYELPVLVENHPVHNVAMMKMLVDELHFSMMAPFYQEFLDFDDLSNKVVPDQQSLDHETILLLYGVALVANRYVLVLPEEKLLELKEKMVRIMDSCPLSQSKVSALVLLIDFHHFRFDINGAYRYLFAAASDAYALGLHETNSLPWLSVAYLDALICSSVGRPTAVNTHLRSLLARTPLGPNMSKVADLVWQSNAQMQRRPQEYSKILELDTDYDNSVDTLTSGDLNASGLAVILIANQIKIHYSFLDRDFSNYKILFLLKKFLRELRLTIKHLKEENVTKKGYPKSRKLRTQYPYVWCFGYQGLLILLGFITKIQPCTESLLEEIEGLRVYVSDNTLFEQDLAFSEILEAVHSALSELQDPKVENPVVFDSIQSVNLNNPLFYHELEFWSNLASNEASV